MTGFLLGQSYGHGRTFQHTVVPGVGNVVAAPAAGANFTYRTGPWDFMRLVFATFSVATSATAGNRYVTIEYAGVQAVSATADGASVVLGPSTAAQRFIGQFARGTAEWGSGTDVFFPLSGIWLEAGRAVTITVGGVQAGDQISAIQLTFDVTPVEGDGSELVDVAARRAQLAGELAELDAALAVG